MLDDVICEMEGIRSGQEASTRQLPRIFTRTRKYLKAVKDDRLGNVHHNGTTRRSMEIAITLPRRCKVDQGAARSASVIAWPTPRPKPRVQLQAGLPKRLLAVGFRTGARLTHCQHRA